MNEIKLSQLDPARKSMLAVFTVVLTTGIILGLIFILSNIQGKPAGLTEHYRGSQVADEFSLPEKYPKSGIEMLLNTHSHILSFAVIFLITGYIFSFSSFPSEKWRKFLMVEPLVATLVTFGSLWGLRYVSPVFTYLIILSGILMYFSYFVMAGFILFETVFKKE